jgi:hypothetical protein
LILNLKAFKPRALPFRAVVAQLDRVPDYESGGRRFDSCRPHHFLRSFKFMKKKKKVSTTKSDPDGWKTTEKAVMDGLSEDLFEAWVKVKKFALSLGEQRVYASGKAVMFSKKTCYFFVRPHKKFLEVVIFLKTPDQKKNFQSVKAVSKIKYAHTFKLIHADQVEGEFTESIQDAYAT